MRCIYRGCRRELPERKGPGRPVKYCNQTCRNREHEIRRRQQSAPSTRGFNEVVDFERQRAIAKSLVAADMAQRGHRVYVPLQPVSLIDFLVETKGAAFRKLNVYVRHTRNSQVPVENLVGWSAFVDPETGAVSYFDPENQGPAQPEAEPAPEAENALNDQQGS